MSSGMGTYDHLNDDDYPMGKLKVEIGMDELAEKIDRLDYGTHRLLSAIARRRLSKDPRNRLGLAIKDALDKGMF